MQILRRALEEPRRILARNVGDPGAMTVATVRRNQQSSGDPNEGYNVLTGAFGSILTQSVIDPVKVTPSVVLIADLPDESGDGMGF